MNGQRQFTPMLQIVKTVQVINLPDVLELRPWYIRWIPGLRYRHHKQSVCFRKATDDQTVYVTEEWLKRVASEKQLQTQCFWNGIPQLSDEHEAQQHKGKPNGQQQQQRRLPS